MKNIVEKYEENEKWYRDITKYNGEESATGPIGLYLIQCILGIDTHTEEYIKEKCKEYNLNEAIIDLLIYYNKHFDSFLLKNPEMGRIFCTNIVALLTQLIYFYNEIDKKQTEASKD